MYAFKQLGSNQEASRHWIVWTFLGSNLNEQTCMGWYSLNAIEVPKGCQHLELVCSIQVEGSFIVVNDVEVYGSAQPALCILFDLLDELASHTQVTELFCHAKCQDVDDVFLV